MNIKVISPTHGVCNILVDDADLKLFDKSRLYVHSCGQFLYVRINPVKKYLHRLIMGEPKGMVIDHINRNTLDNRRSNLKVCTIQQNLRNQKRPSNKTGQTGVSITYNGKYSAQIKHKYKKIHLGIFTSLKDAVDARLSAERRLGWIL